MAASSPFEGPSNGHHWAIEVENGRYDHGYRCTWCRESWIEGSTVATNQCTKNPGYPGFAALQGSKDTNPKDAVGVRKVPLYSVIPQRALAGAALGLMEGARKYGRHNYRVAGVRASVYMDGLKRHMDAWWEGQDVDPDSGLHHVDKMLSDLLVMRDAMLHGKFNDDRPPNVEGDWIADANKLASALIDKHPNPKPAMTQAPGDK